MRMNNGTLWFLNSFILVTLFGDNNVGDAHMLVTNPYFETIQSESIIKNVTYEAVAQTY